MENISKTGLVERMRAEQKNFEQIVAGLSEDQMNAPGAEGEWSLKDVAAHLTFWQERAVFFLQCAKIGYRAEKDLWAGADVDTRNAENFAAQHERRLIEILTDLVRSEEAVIAFVEATPEESIITPNKFGWLQYETLYEAIANETFEHYAEHIEPLRTWRAVQ